MRAHHPNLSKVGDTTKRDRQIGPIASLLRGLHCLMQSVVNSEVIGVFHLPSSIFHLSPMKAKLLTHFKILFVGKWPTVLSQCDGLRVWTAFGATPTGHTVSIPQTNQHSNVLTAGLTGNRQYNNISNTYRICASIKVGTCVDQNSGNTINQVH